MKSSNVVVGILTDWEQMNTLVRASKYTWIKQLPYDIFYFVGRSKLVNATLTTDSNIIELPCSDDEYPPVNKTYAMWHHLYVNYVMNYEFFVAVDSDTYVNVRHLEALIKNLTCRDCYVGYSSPGGNSMWRNRTGIYAPYCQGMGYIISRGTLLQFGPHTHSCRTSFFGRHSDTEIARCIYKHVHNLSCSNGKIPFKIVSRSSNEKNEKIPLRLNARRQMYIDFPVAPQTVLFEAVMVHPLKKPEYFHRFHQQVVQNLRPVLPPILAQKSCVANPILQQEIYPQSPYIPECSPLETNTSFDVKSLHTFILTLPNHEQRVSQLITVLRKHGILAQCLTMADRSIRRISTKLTHDQWHFRLMMIDFLHTALAANFEQTLVLEDKAVPHYHFGSRLQKLLSDTRCGNHILNPHGSGIIMLGATMWTDGWRILDRLNRNETGLCRNICSKTFGSFAVLYHKATYHAILNWLNTTVDEPYDHVFAYLSRLGYPVRFAVPNLVIKDVTFTSLMNQTNENNAYYNPQMRASIHRWNLTEYTFPQYTNA